MKAGTRDRMTQGLPGWLNALLVFGTVATVMLLESRRPLRRMSQGRLTRNLRNATFSLLAATTVAVFERPVVGALSRTVHHKRLGLLKLARIPAALELFLSILLLDYTLYLWHYLTHKLPLLWRFHKVHHADLDMDASTALRFHFGELILSVPWRAAQVRVLGISPLGLSLWQALTLMAIMFHHANLRLPFNVERRLCRVIVTPRMHGIHHSMVSAETDANWSTIFSYPDYLHRTLRLNVPQQQIVIGVASCRSPEQVTLPQILKMPFLSQREDVAPLREPIAIPETTLAG